MRRTEGRKGRGNEIKLGAQGGRRNGSKPQTTVGKAEMTETTPLQYNSYRFPISSVFSCVCHSSTVSLQTLAYQPDGRRALMRGSAASAYPLRKQSILDYGQKILNPKATENGRERYVRRRPEYVTKLR